MNRSPLSTLYSQLPPKERAAVAFSHISEGNELEFQRVASGATQRASSGHHAEYRWWLEGCHRLAAVWGIEYHQTRTCYVASTAAAVIHSLRHEHQAAEAANRSRQEWETSLLALDSALQSVCKANGINPEAVYRMANAEPFEPPFPVRSLDSDYEDHMRKTLTNALGALIVP